MSTKILCCASLAAFVATALPVIGAAARVHPVTALLGDREPPPDAQDSN